MRTVECAREQDVVDALASGRWPARCDSGLPAHVQRCPVCTDVVQVVAAILDTRDGVVHEIPVPSSGMVWWRAQIRARREAAREAARPITVAQAVAGAILTAALVAAVIVIAPWISSSGGVARAALPIEIPTLDLPRLAIPEVTWGIGALVLGASLLVAPLAIYLALSEE